LIACQEAATDPATAGTTNQTSATPTINPAIATKAGAAPVHFTAEGEFGQTFWTPDGGFFNCRFISVNRTGSTSNPGVFLYYILTPCGVTCDEGVCPPPWDLGYGEIPAGDLTLSKRNVNGRHLSVLKLNTNTANDPAFTVYAGNGGQITVEWDRTPGFESVSTGQTVTKFADFYTERVHGTSTTYSATAIGTVLWAEIPTTNTFDNWQSSNIGSNHARTIDITHLHGH
jgi:hypothetical protein